MAVLWGLGDESWQQAVVLSRAWWWHSGVRWCPPSCPEAGGSRVALGEPRSGAEHGSSILGQHLGPILAPPPPAPSSLAGPGLTAIPSTPLHPHLGYLQAPSKHPCTQAESRFPPRGQGAGGAQAAGALGQPIRAEHRSPGHQGIPSGPRGFPRDNPSLLPSGQHFGRLPPLLLGSGPFGPQSWLLSLGWWQCHRGGGRGRMAASAVPCPPKDSQPVTLGLSAERHLSPCCHRGALPAPIWGPREVAGTRGCSGERWEVAPHPLLQEPNVLVPMVTAPTAGQGALGCGVLPSVLPCLHTHGEGRPMVSPGRGRGPPLALTLAPGARVPQAGGSGSAKSQLLRLRSITADSTALGISNHAFDPRSLPSLAFNPFPASSWGRAGSAGDGSCSGESRRCSQHPRRGKHPQAQPTSV